MTLNKSKGNMYGWVTHTWNPLLGRCSHDCSYCYVKSMKRMNTIKERYSGPARIDEKAINDNLGKDRFIFVCNMTDLFADDITDSMIEQVIEHIKAYPDNRYLIQTKNPERALKWVPEQDNYVLGTTAECDMYKYRNLSNAPSPLRRLRSLAKYNGKTTVTIEPIMDIEDMSNFIQWIVHVKPEWISIGADSCKNNLPEPKAEDILGLISMLMDLGFKVHIKNNLNRLMDK